jgi:hypothetical protein
VRYLSRLRGEELGVGADVSGEADVGDNVGGGEEVGAVVVGVDGRVQRRVERLLHDLAEVGGADVQQRAREPAHVLLDGAEVADLLVAELRVDVAHQGREGGRLAADGRRPAAGEVLVDGVQAVPQRRPAEEFRLQELQVQRELQEVHVRLRQHRGTGRAVVPAVVRRPRPLVVHVLRARAAAQGGSQHRHRHHCGDHDGARSGP